MNKLILKLRPVLVLAALATACLVSKSQAATITNTYTQPFDAAGNTTPFTGGSVAGWLNWYGLYGNTAMTNDPAMDAGNDPTSGSLKVYLPFGPGGDQQAFFGSFHNQYGYDFTDTADGLLYTNITFDVRVAAGTKPNAAGNFGSIGVGFYQTGTMGNLTIPGSASNGWVHLALPIDKTKAGISSIAAFLFVYQSYSGYPTNPITFWIDNASLNKGGPPPAPPTLSMEKPIPGLNVIDSSPGINDRQSILSTTTSGNSWVGNATPVTYSFTITNFPTGSSIVAQMFLIGGVSAIPSYETAPDYNEANVVLFAVQGSPTAAQATFQYKVAEPNGNAMIYGNAPYTNAPGSGAANFGSGNLGAVASSTVYGTWKLTFANNTNITVMAPDGTSTNFTITAADAAAFSDASGFSVLLGSQPNSTPAIGQRVVYSRVQIQGVANPLDDNFMTDSTLNTNLWTKLASAPNGVLVVPTNTAYVVNWTVPDIGFSLQIASNLTSSPWQSALLTPVGQIGGFKTTLVPSSSLPAGNAGFFRLIKRSFSQLQVLLPGQTNAPGTVLGYVGTPTPISLAAQGFSPTTVTVNAVDSDFNIISGIIDQVHLTTSDGSAFLPGDMSMANGVATFSGANGVLFQTTGPQTVTGTDTTDGTKTPGTSAPVTINP